VLSFVCVPPRLRKEMHAQVHMSLYANVRAHPHAHTYSHAQACMHISTHAHRHRLRHEPRAHAPMHTLQCLKDGTVAAVQSLSGTGSCRLMADFMHRCVLCTARMRSAMRVDSRGAHTTGGMCAHQLPRHWGRVNAGYPVRCSRAGLLYLACHGHAIEGPKPQRNGLSKPAQRQHCNSMAQPQAAWGSMGRAP